VPRSSLALKIATLVVTVVVALGIVELTLSYRFPIRGVIIRPHPIWLYEFVPDSRKMYRHLPTDGGSVVLDEINHEGRRGPVAASADVPKVVVYGDSYMAAEYSPYAETFPAQLESLLNAGGRKRIQVIDAGVTGYGPDQSLLRLEADLPVLHPQLVIFSIYAGNDFGDLLRNKIFRVEADGRLVDRHPTLAPALAAEFAAAENWPSWQIARAVKSAWQRSTSSDTPGSTVPGTPADALDGPSSTRIDRWLAQGRREYDDWRSDDQVRNLLADGYDAVISLTPSSEPAAASEQLMGAVLARVRAAAASASVPVLLVVIPAAFDAAPDYPLKPDRTKYPDYQPERLTQVVDDLARNAGLTCVDLFPEFSKPGSSRLYFSVGNSHWTAEGEKLAAERVFREIEQRHLLR
jgi:hypothetical protein